MKRLIVILVVLSTVIVVGMYVNRSKPPVANAAETANLPAERPNLRQPTEYRPVPEKVIAAELTPPNVAAASSAPEIPNSAPIAAKSKLLLNQAVETLVSPKTTYEQRQETWKQLRQAGKVDEAITELEQRVTENPRSAVDVTALGEGYYKKAGNTDDVRERAILAMKGDQTLQAALNLEPSNWEARFTKAVGMSYWPAELNKGQEVIQEFLTLIQQQETEAPQPQFARTYVLLGGQYEKAGRADDAAQVWLRGANLFPNDTDLQNKLAAKHQAGRAR
jgi:tetratricopeptide (TPR) repeat protein